MASPFTGAWWSAITYGNGICHRLSKRIDHVAEDRREIPPFVIVESRDGRDAPQRRDVRFVRVAREVRHERDRAAVLAR